MVPSPRTGGKGVQVGSVREDLNSRTYCWPKKVKRETWKVPAVKVGFMRNRSPLMRAKPLYWVKLPPMQIFPVGSNATANT